MTDGADEWCFAAGCGPRDALSIEDPEVFPASAAARHDDLVHLTGLVQPVDGYGDLVSRFKSLYIDRAEQQPHGGPPPPDDVPDILQRGPRLAGDEANALRKPGQRLFAFGGKQALPVEFCFQLLKGELRRADAVREHVVDIDLERTVSLVQGGAAADDDLHPLFGAETEPPRVRPEHHRFDAARLVPQRKITVAAAGVLNKVRDLAPEGKVEQEVVGIQQGLDVLVQRRDGDHFSHNPASRAARMDTPMALSLEYRPGTKYTCGRRCCTHTRMMSLLMTPPAQTTGRPG